MFTCYDWLSLAQCYGKALYQRVFYDDDEEDKERLKLLCDLIEVLRLMTQHTIDEGLIKRLEVTIGATLEAWENVGPPSEQHMVFHHLMHIPAQLRKWGPCRSNWMFPFERFFAFANQTILNRHHIEANFMAVWRTNFLSSFQPHGQVLAGEHKFTSQLEFPYHKPHKSVSLEAAQVRNCVLRTASYKSIYAQYKKARDHERVADNTFDAYLTRDPRHSALHRQWLSLPTTADRYINPVQWKGYTYTTAEWDQHKVSRGSYFRLWGPYLADSTRTRYPEGWCFGRIKHWLRVDFPEMGTEAGPPFEMLWAEVEIWNTPIEQDTITLESIVDISATRVFPLAHYIPLDLILDPVVMVPYSMVQQKPKTPPAVAIWKAKQESEEAMWKQLANNTSKDVTGTCYALLADNKMYWNEEETEEDGEADEEAGSVF